MRARPGRIPSTPVAPAVLFDEDVGGWFVVGFEYVPGRDADLTPGSGDLTLVAATVERISAFSAPGLRKLRDRWQATDWWDRLAEADPAAVAGTDVAKMVRWSSMLPERVDGDRLVHTDLHGGQFVLGESGGVHVVDWGWPAAGPGWVDTAFMVVRLVEAGHAPASAEEWARSLASWSQTDDESVTAFAVYVAGLWSYRDPAGLFRRRG